MEMEQQLRRVEDHQGPRYDPGNGTRLGNSCAATGRRNRRGQQTPLPLDALDTT